MNNPLRVLHALAAAVCGPLWCRVVGHAVRPADINGAVGWICVRCGDWGAW